MVFPRKDEFPLNWLEYREYRHSKDNCVCYSPPTGEEGILPYDPVTHVWYVGICPKHYPAGFAKHGPVPILIDIADSDMVSWLTQPFNAPVFKYLNNLEYYIRCEFENILDNILVIFKLSKFGINPNEPKSVELWVKIAGMINKKIIGVTTVNLGDIFDPFEDLSDATKISWRHLIFFRIRTMIKREYFDQYLKIEEELDQAWDYTEK